MIEYQGQSAVSIQLARNDLDRPLRVRLTSPLAPCDRPLNLPGGARRWERCEFVINPPDDDPCDYWIVLAYAFMNESAFVAPCNTLFINGEPPTKRTFPRAFYRQFHRVIDTHNGSQHPRLLLDTAFIGWHAGRYICHKSGQSCYDFFSQLARPKKLNSLGVVCSATASTAGQRKRLHFLGQLKKHFKDKIAHFGFGFTPLEDKLDGILPYRYQIVLENSECPHYWTEKIADAYLGWGFPLYAGCPNLDEYFDPASFQMLDMNDIPSAIHTIEAKLAQPESADEVKAIAGARERVLNMYNMPIRCARLAQRYYRNDPPQLIHVRDYKSFRLRDKLRRFVRVGGYGPIKPQSST